jgi:hypothetical protein
MEVLNPRVYLDKKWRPSPKILALLVLIMAIIAGALVFGLWLGKKSAPPPQPEAEVVTPITPPETTEEILKPGEVGEPPEDQTPQLPPGTSELPSVVFNTSGKIIEIKSDRLIVAGSGSNFADQKPRELTVIVDSLTTTMKLGQQIKYQGLEGLKYLSAGAEIIIESNENIRGKTEFRAEYVHIL